MFSAGPKPVSNLTVVVNEVIASEGSTSISIILPRFSEEDGKVRYVSHKPHTQQQQNNNHTGKF